MNLPRLWAAIAAGSFIAVLVGGKLLTPAPDQPTPHPDSVVTSVTSSAPPSESGTSGSDGTAPSSGTGPSSGTAGSSTSSTAADLETQTVDASDMRVVMRALGPSGTDQPGTAGEVRLVVASATGPTPDEIRSMVGVMVAVSGGAATFGVSGIGQVRVCVSSPRWQPSGDLTDWRRSGTQDEWCQDVDNPAGRTIFVTMQRS